jgi:hypothetical protein
MNMFLPWNVAVCTVEIQVCAARHWAGGGQTRKNDDYKAFLPLTNTALCVQ